MDPAGFYGHPLVDPGADSELGLEQDAAAELDLVVGRVLEVPSRAGVDGKPEAGADEESIAELG